MRFWQCTLIRMNEARKEGRRRVFLSLGAESRQDYVTAGLLFPAQHHEQTPDRNEYFTKNGKFSYAALLQVAGIRTPSGYQ